MNNKHKVYTQQEHLFTWKSQSLHSRPLVVNWYGCYFQFEPIHKRVCDALTMPCRHPALLHSAKTVCQSCSYCGQPSKLEECMCLSRDLIIQLQWFHSTFQVNILMITKHVAAGGEILTRMWLHVCHHM